MGNIFSNKSFMNRYFSAPKSTGPAKLTDLSGDGKVTQKDVLIGKGVLDAPKQPAKMQEQEGPAKRTRAERQADRDSKKTKRRGDRADKRVKRNEAKIKKLKAKVKDGKETVPFPTFIFPNVTESSEELNVKPESLVIEVPPFQKVTLPEVPPPVIVPCGIDGKLAKLPSPLIY